MTRSKLSAAEVAIVNNFLWNDTWTFRDLSVHQRGFMQRLCVDSANFQLICLAGVLLNTLLLNLQFNLLHMNRYIANAVAIAAVTGWNFWLNLQGKLAEWHRPRTGLRRPLHASRDGASTADPRISTSLHVLRRRTRSNLFPCYARRDLDQLERILARRAQGARRVR